MTLYKRSNVWWYEFEFRGQRIRESSHTRTKSVAERIERERRRQMELGSAGLKEHRSPQMFSVASRKWLEANKTHWSASNYRIESINLGHLTPHFGRQLLLDITGDDISRYQALRKDEVPVRARSTWKWARSAPSCVSIASGQTFSLT
jgi:hypothetical protein